jgi:putative SOS response-associated peptidase YedK
MCGRFTLTTTPHELLEAFPGLLLPQAKDALVLRYNIAPSQPIAVIIYDGKLQLDFFNWGLIPSWAKDVKIGHRMINARAETLSEKPSFKAAYRNRRCIIPTSGFYEWQRHPDHKTKTPYYIHMTSKLPFAMAGLWDIWSTSDGSEIRSCSIITTTPNQLIAPIHNRMPVILKPSSYSLWLDPRESSPLALDPLLQSFPADYMAAYPVSTFVNSPGNDSPVCIQPL